MVIIMAGFFLVQTYLLMVGNIPPKPEKTEEEEKEEKEKEKEKESNEKSEDGVALVKI